MNAPSCQSRCFAEWFSSRAQLWVRFLALVALAEPRAFASQHYVNADNATPIPPHTTWATAATTIQDAIDFSSAGDEVVVTNGVYATGGHVVYGVITNRVAVTKPLTVRSV